MCPSLVMSRSELLIAVPEFVPQSVPLALTLPKLILIVSPGLKAFSGGSVWDSRETLHSLSALRTESLVGSSSLLRYAERRAAKSAIHLRLHFGEQRSDSASIRRDFSTLFHRRSAPFILDVMYKSLPVANHSMCARKLHLRLQANLAY